MQTQGQREKKIMVPKPRGSNNNEKKARRMSNVIFKGSLIGKNRNYSHKVMLVSEIKQVGKRSYLEEPISFSKEDLGGIIKPHKYPLIIEPDIGEDCKVDKVW